MNAANSSTGSGRAIRSRLWAIEMTEATTGGVADRTYKPLK